MQSVLMYHCWPHEASSRRGTARGGTRRGVTRGSRGDARGEQSRSSSLVQVHRARQMGLNSGRQRQLRNDGDGIARRWQHSITMAAQQEIWRWQRSRRCWLCRRLNCRERCQRRLRMLCWWSYHKPDCWTDHFRQCRGICLSLVECLGRSIDAASSFGSKLEKSTSRGNFN